MPAGARGQPWKDMDYGPRLTASLEIGRGNFAYKAVGIRLDKGKGGVSKGNTFVIFDTDTLRWAAGWKADGFIDWANIAFNGRHAVHARVIGDVKFQNPPAPGWADPSIGSFKDPRFRGRDGKAYGPLPRAWGRYTGLYVNGGRVVVSYTVGDAKVLESPGLAGEGDVVVFTRTINVGRSSQDLVVQVLHEGGGKARLAQVDGAAVAFLASTGASAAPAGGSANGFNFAADFSIAAWIKTTDGGTIVAKGPARGEWAAKGKTFFVRGGRLGYDIGWVGDAVGRTRVNDGNWHHVALTSEQGDGSVRLYVDGKLDGRGRLKSGDDSSHVVRVGYTATSFMKPFRGSMDEVRIYRRTLSAADVKTLARGGKVASGLAAHWDFEENTGKTSANRAGGGHQATLAGVRWTKGHKGAGVAFGGRGHVQVAGPGAPKTAEKETPPPPAATGAIKPDQPIAAAALASAPKGVQWITDGDDIRLKIPAASTPARLTVLLYGGKGAGVGALAQAAKGAGAAEDLSRLTKGGPAQWKQTVTTEARPGTGNGPWVTDVLTVPFNNPYRAWMRTSGFDFFADGRRAAVCTWNGDCWIVSGIGGKPGTLTWKRIAAGMFQPLGLKIVDETIYVCNRDQITILRDLNGDGETDFYENFNNDHQVTEHFHEFAMDLQTDRAGNFYYAKAARHAKDSLVEHHGTIVKVSKDGSKSEIVCNGFRAPNGLLVAEDGATFITSDQEGHWTPMNRINWCVQGGFYGNMMSYHRGERPADDRYDKPLCWIHKRVDRSPAAQLFVKGKKWGLPEGSLISLSYGVGKIWNVIYEDVNGQKQGGLVAMPVGMFPTGIMRGRFHPGDGQLYACGMFGWSSNRTQPGGFYRIRHTGKPVHLPVRLHATKRGVVVVFPRPVDRATAGDKDNYSVSRWNYRRTRSYGSRDYRVSDGKRGRDQVGVTGATVSRDGKSVLIETADMVPCQQMEIRYRIKAADGASLRHTIHNTVNVVGPKMPPGF